MSHLHLISFMSLYLSELGYNEAILEIFLHHRALSSRDTKSLSHPSYSAQLCTVKIPWTSLPFPKASAERAGQKDVHSFDYHFRLILVCFL